jgi:hypothetical protein
VDRFDAERIAAKQTAGKGVVDLRFDGACAIKGFAEPDQAGISMQADPQHIGEFLRAQGFNRRDFHGSRSSRL